MLKRTDKHLLKLDFNTHPTEAQSLLDVMLAFQKQKNLFSDMLNSYHWNDDVNLLQGSDFRTIRNSLKGYETPFVGLSARLWRMALSEAFDLHFRTLSAQVDFLQEKIFAHLSYNSPVWKELKEKDETLFKQFIHLSNTLFFNFANFTLLEKCLFSYKFKKHQLGKCSIAYIENFKQFLQEPKYEKLEKTKAPFLYSNQKIRETVKNILKESNSAYLKKYVYLIVNKVKKHYHQTNQIMAQINPTMMLDKECYNIYSENGKNYIDIVSLISFKRIKRIELSGYKNSLPKEKNRAKNLCVSFDPTEAQFYVHFVFENKNNKKNINTKQTSKNFENFESFESFENFLGADFGESELLTLSDRKVIGDNQTKFLKQIVEETKKALRKVQLNTIDDLFFGIERKNFGRRNNHNNAFNHHKGKENINYEYRHHQTKINRRVDQYLRKCLQELDEHCQKNNITELVVEKLSYSQLGRNKMQRATINLIKGFYGLVEEKLNNIKLTFVNPAYTSQTCPHCGYVHKENRNGDKFCCRECNYVPNVKDEYGHILCSEADYVGAINIAKRHLKPMIWMKQAEIKKFLLNQFEENKKEKLQLSKILCFT